MAGVQRIHASSPRIAREKQSVLRSVVRPRPQRLGSNSHQVVKAGENVNAVEILVAETPAEEELSIHDALIYPGLYAPSGVDMMSILIRVATRPNPKIPIGAVDSSCALVLCDVTQFDMPIIYCSAPFEQLTGYTSNEIIGRNCRFLQSPKGVVKAGTKRTHSEDSTVIELKQKIAAREEAQTVLRNYKKDGTPFTNLLTTIPIGWDSAEVRFIVGFQVDERSCFV